MAFLTQHPWRTAPEEVIILLNAVFDIGRVPAQGPKVRRFPAGARGVQTPGPGTDRRRLPADLP